MSKEWEYLAFAIEEYRKARNLTGEQVYRIFDKYNFFDYIIELYELFHIESERNLFRALDEYQARQTS